MRRCGESTAQLSLHNSSVLYFTPVFDYFRKHRWKKHTLSNQSKNSLGNVFKDTSSQQVKRMLSRDCILVRFSWFGPEQTVWCEKEPKRLKIATMYHFLPLVWTKASGLSDFPGVNTPLRPVHIGTNIGARYSPAFFNVFFVFTPKRLSLTMSRVNMQIHSLTLDGA